MRAQLERLSLLWPLFLSLRMGAAENTAVVLGVYQTPPCIRAMEGSEFTIECTFTTDNNSAKWFAEWNKTRNNVTEKVYNGTDRIILSADKEKRSLSLTVKKADVTDSGTYVCGVGSKHGTSPGNGTQVTIDGAAENTAVVLGVYQTPPCIRAMEGSEFTIECTFTTDNNSAKWFAVWNKTRNNVTEEVCHGTDRIILSADKEKRSLSLTVKKADVTDSGTYVCGVGSKHGTFPGKGTQVTIDDKRSNASHVVLIIRMVLGALVITLAVIIVTECAISEKRAAVSQTI
ncbi:uncharacterized protein LOC141996781 [Natator depressus]|uniref:uncharacterized protein LOC141996781 n=1 Tax=Natator depressus TaxID=27790 RepID=UPI003EB6DFF7